MPVNFDKWCEKAYWSVLDGAMLLVNAEPTGVFPPARLSPSERWRFDQILSAASEDLGRNLPLPRLPEGARTVSPVLPFGPKANAPFVLVAPGSWLQWARRRHFEIPELLQAAAVRQRLSGGLQAERQSELEALVMSIEEKAANAAIRFDRESMPGTKNQFKRLVKDHCPALAALEGDTLNDYLDRANCKFARGRNPLETAIWRDLGLEK